MSLPYFLLTTDNIKGISKQTGYSQAKLIKLLIEYNSRGVYPVKIPQVSASLFGFKSGW